MEFKLQGFDDYDWVDHRDKRAHKSKKCKDCFIKMVKKS